MVTPIVEPVSPLKRVSPRQDEVPMVKLPVKAVLACTVTSADVLPAPIETGLPLTTERPAGRPLSGIDTADVGVAPNSDSVKLTDGPPACIDSDDLSVVMPSKGHVQQV